ncbi:hypothetical protein E5Q_00153 [Mixia osmundae IAM 14324]|uniref:ferric-chelate reductase (NADPH) n=1 Tax=Mixia osmundae (strain CBS 9802 / IAM 14324 / JCM 22182 / KY 12970) TaxID=764103 RepID=G7DSF2_MIXOS|nr:hypothetical protein E5Q_00153 [Mixia osmundae IAM 14324]
MPTSISFAAVASSGLGGATQTASVAASTTSAASVVWSSSNPLNNNTFKTYFLIPYFFAHELSWPSFRYAYVLWFVIGAVLLIWSLLHQFGHGDGGVIGAFVRSYTIRRLDVGIGKSRHHVQPLAHHLAQASNDRKSTLNSPTSPIVTTQAHFDSPDHYPPAPVRYSQVGAPAGKSRGIKPRRFLCPTLSQIVTLVIITVVLFSVSYFGDDYLAPTDCVLSAGVCKPAISSGPPKSTIAPQKRSLLEKRKAVDTSLNPNGWAPFNDPLLTTANYRIAKNYWTSSSRVGMIAYALLPLVITLAVKLWPFNIFAIPFLTNYGFDKTAFFHRWVGRLIFALSTVHVGLWTKQLLLDIDPYGNAVFYDVWIYYRFIAGVVAYVALCAMVVLSFNPLRSRFYELFYYSHVALSIAFLVGCLVHFETLQYWAIAALALWGGERATRGAIWCWINGLGKRSSKEQTWSPARKDSDFTVHSVEKQGRSPYQRHDMQQSHYALNEHADVPAPYAQKNLDSVYAYGGANMPSTPNGARPGLTPMHSVSHSTFNLGHTLQSSTDSSLLPVRPGPIRPPPGYAYAQLLPGRTIRLTLRTPRKVSWAPGQNCLLTVPSIAFWQSHPYTMANAISSQNADQTDLIFLIRTRQGFTKDLWNSIVAKRRQKEAQPGTYDLTQGVMIRAQVSNALGSASRARWADYSSAIIYCGGSGVSFGLSVLEHLCQQMALRDAAARRGASTNFKLERVRFVWILREYAHLSWIAPQLRKCLDMCPPSQLQVDLFVTRDAVKSVTASTQPEQLRPPPSLNPDGRPSLVSVETSATQASYDAEAGGIYDMYQEDEDATEFVLFEGEEDVRTTGEAKVSATVRKEGRLRRARSRISRGLAPGRSEALAPLTHPPARKSSYKHAPSASQSSLAPSYNAESRRPSSGNVSMMSAAVEQDSSFEKSDFYDRSLYASSTQNILGSMQHLSPFRDEHEDIYLDVGAADKEDLDIIAELARSGKPRLEQIADQEVRRASGKIVVASCGPTALNAQVRRLVADRISPRKIWQGDQSGQIVHVCEEFTY